MNIGGVDYTVKAVISTGRDGVKYYDHKLTAMEKGKLLSLADRVSTTERTKDSLPLDIDDKRLIQILQDNSQETDTVRNSTAAAQPSACYLILFQI